MVINGQRQDSHLGSLAQRCTFLVAPHINLHVLTCTCWGYRMVFVPVGECDEKSRRLAPAWMGEGEGKAVHQGL